MARSVEQILYDRFTAIGESPGGEPIYAEHDIDRAEEIHRNEVSDDRFDAEHFPEYEKE